MPSNLHARISGELLPYVNHPAQYIGGEVNQLVRAGDWEAAEVRVAIGFPDAYTIGMSHLGCQILYWLCNHTPGVCAERTYAPWIDAERIMRARGIPLFTWDARQRVADADIFAVSLQYELCFTTLLNMLDLAGIPIRSDERLDEHPLVIVGGPQADNSEPVADFVDLVVIGDGEESMAAILAAVREYKAAGVRRREMIPLLARRFAWIYAPGLYDVQYGDDGTIAAMLPRAAGIPTQIDRCKTPDFEHAPFPMRPLVPWIRVVHDRIGIEIMRGCPQVCRFCHAGYTKRPLHYRSVDEILDIAERAYHATGHQEISLLSLSTADYPLLRELANRFHERFSARRVSLSFPSLRIDKMLQHIPWMANDVRKSGITMAVEAARDDMRRAIRKKVTDGNLMDGVREVYKAGWNRVKLYFMAGFPGERRSDIDGIWELANAVSLERRSIGKSPAQVTASVGWLVPKPFTPFQWMAQPRVEYFREVRARLQSLAKRRGGVVTDAMGGYAAVSEMTHDDAADAAVSPGRAPEKRKKRGLVQLRMHQPERSILEAVLSRGDRRLGPVIHEAWRRGARFDGWDECYDDRRWREAFDRCSVDPDWYAHRERGFGEINPWDHIGLHMRREYLEKSYEDVFEQIGEPPPEALRSCGPRKTGADRGHPLPLLHAP